MDKLIQKYLQKLNFTSTEFRRSLVHDINWNARLIGIKGARGVGKTTLLLQYIKINQKTNYRIPYMLVLIISGSTTIACLL
jgi:predicted AAA+ superfamily ATPase